MTTHWIRRLPLWVPGPKVVAFSTEPLPSRLASILLARRNEREEFATGVVEEYTFNRHRHRFAAWCAATASGASGKCRFSVQLGVKLMEQAGLPDWLENLPSAEVFDTEHARMRERLAHCASTASLYGMFSPGIAAKMINCYLKSAFIGHEQELNYIHPPIDRILIEALRKTDVGEPGSLIWAEINENGGWSSMTSELYEDAIARIKQLRPGALWAIEEYWIGYQTRKGLPVLA